LRGEASNASKTTFPASSELKIKLNVSSHNKRHRTMRPNKNTLE
jgi:hypothetical protein